MHRPRITDPLAETISLSKIAEIIKIDHDYCLITENEKCDNPTNLDTHKCDTCKECLQNMKCLQCDFHMNEKLIIHKSEVRGAKSDLECDKKYDDLNQLKVNKCEYHEKCDNLSKETHKCDSCEESFHTKEKLIIHKSEVHGAKNSFTCEKCDKKFDDLEKFTLHKYEDHVENLICEKCEKKFDSSNKLANHMKIGKKIY